MSEIKLSVYMEIDWKNFPEKHKKDIIKLIEKAKARETKISEKFKKFRVDMEVIK